MTPHMSRISRIRYMTDESLAQHADREQAWANRLQSMAAAAQSEADAARKEIKRRKREAKTA